MTPFKPGQTSISADALTRVAQGAQRAAPLIPGNVRGAAGFVTPQGTCFVGERPRVRLAKITGVKNFNSGSGNTRNCDTNIVGYEWLPQRTAVCGGTEDADDFQTEYGTIDYFTAFEANGDPSVSVGSIVLLWEAFNSTKNGREWIFWNGSGGGGEIVVRVLGNATQDIQSGCASGGDPLQCPLRLHYAVTQSYNQECSRWDDGQCILVADIEGRNLHIGRRYMASRLDTLISALQATVLPVDSPCRAEDYGPGTTIYITTLTNPTFTILIQSEIGQLCYNSGAGGASLQVFEDDPNLTIYQAAIQRWNPETCLYADVDTAIYAAELHGCSLEIGIHYEAHYETVIPAFNSGAGTETCYALYLVDHVPATPRGVADVRAGANGDIQIYVWQSAGRCGEVSAVLSHTIHGCCNEPPSGGTSGGSGTPCCGGREIGPMYATVPGAGSFAMTYDGSEFWIVSISMPCGRTLWLRWSKFCSADYSCDGINWVPMGSPIGADTDDCGPPFVSRQYDGANMDNINAGCDTVPACGIVNGIYFSE